jgi:phosphatidate phosphatase APP1
MRVLRDTFYSANRAPVHYLAAWWLWEKLLRLHGNQALPEGPQRLGGCCGACPKRTGEFGSMS